jgi:hypothetical protein
MKQMSVPQDITQQDNMETFCRHIYSQSLLLWGQHNATAFAGKAILAVRNDIV